MNRRHFVKLTGVSLSSLILVNYIKGEPVSPTLIKTPDTVKILSGNEYLSLKSSDKQTWIYQDFVVVLKPAKNSVAIFIQSPSMPLKEVQLSWNYSTSKNAKITGDAWERSYGDLSFQSVRPTRRLPWYFVEHSENGSNCFGVKTDCSAFCYWCVSDTSLELNLDTRNSSNGVSLGSRILHAADIVTTKNTGNENTFATARRFCKQLCDKPKTVRQPVYGINDWYFAYGNNSAGLILEHTSLLASLASNADNKPFSVIDDGWSLGTDYTKTNGKFPDMPKLVGEIKKLGMRPGLWTRPLLAKPGENNKLFIHKNEGVLDPTIEENIEYIQNLFRLYKQWGFEMVKHDYTTYDIFAKWGKDMENNMTEAGWQFNDSTKTNAEIISHLYESIREGSDEMYLIGCNTISHLSAGVFELCRIGDDTSGKEWARTKMMGVNTMGFRMVQHKTFYEADGDCVGLTTAVPWEKNKQWMQLLAQSSAPLFISAQPNAVGAEQKTFIRKCFTEASKEQPVGEPLDWLTNEFPSKWKLDKKVVRFNWD
jgi:alpha-galactosidase